MQPTIMKGQNQIKISISPTIDVKPLDINKATRDAFPQKLGRDARGRLIDPVTGERVRYVLNVNAKGELKIRVPGETFKDARGTEYMVMPSGSIRRLTPRKGE